MIALTGATIVLAGRAVGPGNLVLAGDRIAEVAPTRRPPAGTREVDLHGCFIVPGFVDVHVLGVEGCDTLDAPSPIAEIARRLMRYGVTAFCPTTVACSPAALRTVLAAGGEARRHADPRGCPRAARAPREQLHQPRLQGCAAGRVPAPAIVGFRAPHTGRGRGDV